MLSIAKMKSLLIVGLLVIQSTSAISQTKPSTEHYLLNLDGVYHEVHEWNAKKNISCVLISGMKSGNETGCYPIKIKPKRGVIIFMREVRD